MSRKIKFRIWDKVDNEFKSFMDGDFVSGQFYSPYPIEEFVVQQWTGLFDKNEVEIYEGDVLDILNHDQIEVVEFVGTGFGFFKHENSGGTDGNFELLSDYTGSDGYTVVGNIFENSELI